MFKSEFNEIVREHFDLSDRNTCKYIATLEDAGQEQLLNALSSALYDDIVKKVDDIDFGTIPSSRGDITKVQGFEKTEKCLDIIRQLVIEYKQNPAIVDVVISAIANIKDRKAMFIRAYMTNAEFPMLMYNLMVLSVERSVSLMIATCIQYIKDPSSSNPKMALDKVAYTKTMDDMLYKQVVTFNNICADGSFDKIVNNIFKNAVKESVEAMECGDCATAVDEEPVQVGSTDELFGDNSATAEPYQPEEQPAITPATNTDAEVPAAAPMVADPASSEDFPETHFDDNDQPVPGVAQTDELPSAEPVPADEVPVAAEVEEENIDADTEIEFNDVPAQVNDPVEAPQEPEVELSVDPATPTDAAVEPENIPQVTPVDNTTVDTVAPVTEEDGKSEDETVEEGVNDVLKRVGNLANSSTKAKIIGTIAALGLAVGAVKGLGFIVTKCIIPGLRNLVYGFYYSMMKFSDYLEIQSELIEANANELEASTTSEMDENKKKKVVEKQRKTAAKLRKWSDRFNIDSKESSKKAEKQIKEDEKNKKKISKDEDGDDSLF